MAAMASTRWSPTAATGLKINLSSGFVDYNPYGEDWGWHDTTRLERRIRLSTSAIRTPHGDPEDATGIENVIGSKFNDAIFGNEAANNISGGNGDDWLSGLGGDDFVSGGNGNDWIYGGLGADTLTGGANADTFIFWSADASKFTGGRPQDIITDFQHGLDAIDLSGLDIALNDLLEVDNQTIDGANYSYVGVDANQQRPVRRGRVRDRREDGAGLDAARERLHLLRRIVGRARLCPPLHAPAKSAGLEEGRGERQGTPVTDHRRARR